MLQAELGIKSQRHFYRICCFFPCGRLLERSRFNRRAIQLIGLVQLIRQAMNRQLSPNAIVIMDSFPLPLCHPVRNHRARIFAGQADIGYNIWNRKDITYGLRCDRIWRGPISITIGDC